MNSPKNYCNKNPHSWGIFLLSWFEGEFSPLTNKERKLNNQTIERIYKIMLSNKQVVKFQMLYKNRFNKEIGQEEALEKGIKLLRLVELIYKPITEKEYRQLKNRRQITKNL